MNLIFTISIALNHDIPVISTYGDLAPVFSSTRGTGLPGGAGVFSAPGRFEKKNLPLLCSWRGSWRFRSYARPRQNVVLPMAPRHAGSTGSHTSCVGAGCQAWCPMVASLRTVAAGSIACVILH